MAAVSVKISAKVKQICKNVQNINQIKEVLEDLKTGETDLVEESIDVLFGVFSFHIVKKSWIKIENVADDKKDEKTLAKDIISSWLANNFESFLQLLVAQLNVALTESQCGIIDKFFKLVSLENEHLWQGESEIEKKLLARFDVLFSHLIKMNFTEELVDYINQKMENLDVQYLFLRKVHEVCSAKSETEEASSGLTNLAADNCLNILQLVSMNHINVKEDEAVLYFTKDDKFIRKNYRKSAEQAWLAFLRMENISSVLRKKTLVDMDTKIIPFLSNPKILIDFLTDSYNSGGVTSLLALNGLFVLINEHNLDYPDFYFNLYKIIDPSIFHMKYKSRFFHYIDMFLTSTHLPVYLIAAFVKKFSRMLLFTPSTDILMVLTLIKNLLIRHASTRVLIHRKKTVDQASSDPYIYDEPNPAECHAIKSSLWELSTLSSHFSSDVKTMVASFKKDFPDAENDMTEHFDCSYEDLFGMKVEKLSTSVEEAPVNFTKSKELFDTNSDMWFIE